MYVCEFMLRDEKHLQIRFLKQFDPRVSTYNNNMASADEDHIELQVRDRAFNRRIKTFAIVNKDHVDVRAFLNDAARIYKYVVSNTVNEHRSIKTLSVFVVEFEKVVNANPNNDGDDDDEDDDSERNQRTVKQTVYLSTSCKTIGLTTNLDEHYENNIVNELVQSIDDSAFRGSGFSLARIIELDVQINSHQPLKGSSFIKTPEKIRAKKSIVNVQNKDEMCFKWAILSNIYEAKHNPHRLSHYLKYSDKLNFEGIDFPVRLDQIDKFTRQNEKISVNVYYYDDEDSCIRSLRVSTDVRERHIHLLLLFKESKNNDGESGGTTADKVKAFLNDGPIQMHYCWIKNLSGLVGAQLSKNGHKKHICDRCLNYFTTADILERHLKNCNSGCTILMPTEEAKWIKFENHKNWLKAPFVIYADTESFLKNLSVEERNRVFSEKCKTKAYQQHHVYSVGYYFKCEFDSSKSYYATSGNRPDCIEWFMDELEAISKRVIKMIHSVQPMHRLDPDEEAYVRDLSNVCFICEKPFALSEQRHRDHCHFTGKFRGVAHARCNLNFQETRTIPVIMHNLSGYDSHLFIKQLALKITGDVTIIPLNAEEYISFTKTVETSTPRKTKIKLKFLDSFRFMAESLSKLSSTIPRSEKRILYAECEKTYSPNLIRMLEQKGVFPYDYVDSFERLSETALPPQEAFYNQLNGEKLSNNDYKFALEIWKKFKIKTIGEYSELYMKTDVLLLADVFENFRSTCHRIYKLDPAHYYTSPGLSFDAMLKHTDVEIELQTDIEKFIFCERGIRGGISQCSKRYIKPNNKFMPNYNPKKETIYGMFLDREYFSSVQIMLKKIQQLFDLFILIRK